MRCVSPEKETCSN